MNSIDYEPTDPKLARHYRVMGQLTVHQRQMRENRQAKAQQENALVRKAEDDRRRRQPGNTPA